LGNATFQSLTLSAGAGVITNSGSSIIAGTFTVNAGSTFSPSAADVISGSGTLTGSGTVQVTRTAATADLASQYTLTKILTNLTVDYHGSGEILTNTT
jgi:hypothetical protein